MRLDELQTTIANSHPDEWQRIKSTGPTYRDRFSSRSSPANNTSGIDHDSHVEVAVYRPDIDLTIAYGMSEGLHDHNLKFAWSENFADSKVREISIVDIFWRGSLVDRLNYARQSDLPVMQQLAEAIITAYGGTPEEVPEVYEAHSVLAHTDRMNMPFLLASGECDALIPVEKVRLVAEALKDKPHFTYREVEGGDHDSPLWLPVEEMLRCVGYEVRDG